MSFKVLQDFLSVEFNRSRHAPRASLLYQKNNLVVDLKMRFMFIFLFCFLCIHFDVSFHVSSPIPPHPGKGPFKTLTHASVDFDIVIHNILEISICGFMTLVLLVKVAYNLLEKNKFCSFEYSSEYSYQKSLKMHFELGAC